MLLGDDLRAARAELAQAEARGRSMPRKRRDGVDQRLMEVAHTREETERRFAEHGRERERLSGACSPPAPRWTGSRCGVGVGGRQRRSAARADRALGARPRVAAVQPASGLRGRLARKLGELEAELERWRPSARRGSTRSLPGSSPSARRPSAASRARRPKPVEASARARTARGRDGGRDRRARGRGGRARRGARAERRRGRAGARPRAPAPLAAGAATRLRGRLDVEPGYEAAVAAALGGLLGAAIVLDGRRGRAAMARAAGDEGGRASCAGARARRITAGAPPVRAPSGCSTACEPAADAADVANALLADAWVVDSLGALPTEFSGIAVTRAGIAYDGRRGEVRRLPAGGGEQDLAERNRLAGRSRPTSRPRRAAARRGARGRDARGGGRGRARGEPRESSRPRGATRAGRAGSRGRGAPLRLARRAAPRARRRAPRQRAAQLEAEIAAERHVADRLAERAARASGAGHGLERSLERDRPRCPRASGPGGDAGRTRRPCRSGARASSRS